jgi:ABC-2 type transport system ATP-binding protein
MTDATIRGEPPEPTIRGEPPEATIRIEAVSKWFHDVVAVSEVSFDMGHGVTALLGPNGAGKSTILRMIAGLTAPSQGAVRVLDGDPHRDLGLLRQIGLVPQQDALFESLTCLEFVRLAASLQRMSSPREAAAHALETVGLDPSDRRQVASFSKGMRQRVKVAQAIVHEPQVLVLDEPLTGLDPRQRVHLIELFQRLGAEGRTVVVSSHVLDEVERFGSRVLVLAQGRLAAEGDFRAIRDLMDDRPHRIRVRSDRARALAGSLLGHDGVVAVRLERDDTVIVDTVDATQFRRAIAPLAAELHAHLYEVSPLDDDLESVFRYLVGP